MLSKQRDDEKTYLSVDYRCFCSQCVRITFDQCNKLVVESLRIMTRNQVKMKSLLMWPCTFLQQKILYCTRTSTGTCTGTCTKYAV